MNAPMTKFAIMRANREKQRHLVDRRELMKLLASNQGAAKAILEIPQEQYFSGPMHLSRQADLAKVLEGK